MAAVISLEDILNSVSPNPSICTFVGTHATIAAGMGAVGFPKSEINSNNLAPIELTYERERERERERVKITRKGHEKIIISQTKE
jgi:hypothetical protein